MSHDIRQSFIHRARDGAAIRRRKTENLREAFKSAAHNTEQLRIAVQLQLQ
jgi:hypothetical protein